MDETVSFDLSTWEKVKVKLKRQVGETVYNNWLKQLKYKSSEDETLTLSVPTKFLRDWILTHYAEKIKIICKEYHPKLIALKIVVKQEFLLEVKK